MQRYSRHVVVAVLLLALVYGLGGAILRSWSCDDAFISFRYADNLARGAGLVYNAGERVEGYTNFLWTLLVAGGVAIGVDPRAAANALGVASYAALLWMLLWWGVRCARRRGQLYLPLGAAILALQDDLQLWATGGLETSFFAALALAGVLLLARDDRLRRHALLGGVALGLACLARPDGLIFAAVGLLACWLVPPPNERDSRAAHLLLASAGVVVLVAAHAAFKLSYYGELLPTAFFAKSASRPQYLQGLVYIGLYLSKHWVLPVGLLLVLVGLWRLGKLRAAARQPDVYIYAAAFALFSAYVAHSGGDFMFARRLVPAVPFLLIALEGALSWIQPAATRVAIGAALAAGSLLPAPIYPEEPARIAGVANEHRFYPERVIEMRRRQAELAREVLRGVDLRAAIGGGMCVFGYYSRLPYLVESNGLTQYSLARGGRILPGAPVGHQRVVRDEWMRANGVRLVFHNDFAPLSRGPKARFDDLFFGDQLRARIVQYDPRLMGHLARDGRVRFLKIEELLKQLERALGRLPCREARRAYERIARYYFDLAAEKDATARAKRDALKRLVSTACRAAP